MKQSTMRRVAVLSLLILFAGTAIGAVDRPLKLKGRSVVMGDPFASAGAPFSTTGTGTHLGRFSGKGNVFFAPGSGGIEGTGTQTLRAANGDEIVTEFSGVLVEGEADVLFTITDGTGRFEFTQGQQFVAHVQADPLDPAVFTFTIDDRIKF